VRLVGIPQAIIIDFTVNLSLLTRIGMQA